MVGNLVTDMLNLEEVRQLKGDYALGVELHRWIDHYTDADPNVAKINRILSPVQHKYAPVASDILFDFLISHNWYRIANESFDDFCDTAYSYILCARHPLPKHINARLERMVKHKWLHNQALWSGLIYTLNRMDERTRFPSDFSKAGSQLMNNFREINRLFMKFFASIESDCKKRDVIPQN